MRELKSVIGRIRRQGLIRKGLIRSIGENDCHEELRWNVLSRLVELGVGKELLSHRTEPTATDRRRIISYVESRSGIEEHAIEEAFDLLLQCAQLTSTPPFSNLTTPVDTKVTEISSPSGVEVLSLAQGTMTSAIASIAKEGRLTVLRDGYKTVKFEDKVRAPLASVFCPKTEKLWFTGTGGLIGRVHRQSIKTGVIRQPDDYPFGEYYRLQVSGDGRRLMLFSQEGLRHYSCQIVDTRNPKVRATFAGSSPVKAGVYGECCHYAVLGQNRVNFFDPKDKIQAECDLNRYGEMKYFTPAEDWRTALIIDSWGQRYVIHLPSGEPLALLPAKRDRSYKRAHGFSTNRPWVAYFDESNALRIFDFDNGTFLSEYRLQGKYFRKIRFVENSRFLVLQDLVNGLAIIDLTTGKYGHYSHNEPTKLTATSFGAIDRSFLVGRSDGAVIRIQFEGF